MSAKIVRFSPEGSTRVLRMQVIPIRWTASSAYSTDGFLQSWFEDESTSDEVRSPNWGAISGLAISFAISATFWVGAGFLIERLLK